MTLKKYKENPFIPEKNMYFAKFSERKSVLCHNLRVKKSVYTDKLNMSGRSGACTPIMD